MDIRKTPSPTVSGGLPVETPIAEGGDAFDGVVTQEAATGFGEAGTTSPVGRTVAGERAPARPAAEIVFIPGSGPEVRGGPLDHSIEAYAGIIGSSPSPASMQKNWAANAWALYPPGTSSVDTVLDWLKRQRETDPNTVIIETQNLFCGRVQTPDGQQRIDIRPGLAAIAAHLKAGIGLVGLQEIVVHGNLISPEIRKALAPGETIDYGARYPYPRDLFIGPNGVATHVAAFIDTMQSETYFDEETGKERRRFACIVGAPHNSMYDGSVANAVAVDLSQYELVRTHTNEEILPRILKPVGAQGVTDPDGRSAVAVELRRKLGGGRRGRPFTLCCTHLPETPMAPRGSRQQATMIAVRDWLTEKGTPKRRVIIGDFNKYCLEEGPVLGPATIKNGHCGVRSGCSFLAADVADAEVRRALDLESQIRDAETLDTEALSEEGRRAHTETLESLRRQAGEARARASAVALEAINKSNLPSASMQGAARSMGRVFETHVLRQPLDDLISNGLRPTAYAVVPPVHSGESGPVIYADHAAVLGAFDAS